MKKKQLIRIIQDKNNSEVEFVNNYNRLSKELNLENIPPLGYDMSRKRKYNSLTVFKYATLMLLVFTIFLSAILLHTIFHKQDYLGPTNAQLVHQYFIDNDTDYLEYPIKTDIIDDSIINIYLGMTKDSNIVFVYATEDTLIRQINIKAYSTGGDASDDTVNTSLMESDDFAYTVSEMAKHFTLEFSYLGQDDLEKVYRLTIEISNYIDYLKKTGQKD